MTRWEYLSVETRALDGIEGMNALGADGWLLCTIAGGMAYFARDLDGVRLKEQADRHAQERGAA